MNSILEVYQPYEILDALAKHCGYAACEVEVYTTGSCYLYFATPDSRRAGGENIACIHLIGVNGDHKYWRARLMKKNCRESI